MTAIAREQQRLIALAKSGLSKLTSVGVFESAAREIVAGLDVAIGAIGSIDSDSIVYQGVACAAYAGQTFLSSERSYPRAKLLCDALIECDSTLYIRDLARDPNLAMTPALQEFGIRAYLGVPLRNANGDCLGAIEAIDLAPHYFSTRDIQLLELIARSLVLELERAPDMEFLAADRPAPSVALTLPSEDRNSQRSTFDRLRSDFIDRLVQDLRTPLTSVLGMTSILNKEIYGSLRPKQKEYLSIVHDSGQQMLGVVDSLISLQELDGRDATLSITTVNLGDLCQQLSNRLIPKVERRNCKLEISLDREDINWPLDRLKVELTLFHLLAQTLDASDEECTLHLDVRIHQERLRFEVWVAHPWLGNSLPASTLTLFGLDEDSDDITADLNNPDPIVSNVEPVGIDLLAHLESQAISNSRLLGLSLSCHLFAQHSGQVSLVGCPDSGYRYILDLPSPMAAL